MHVYPCPQQTLGHHDSVRYGFTEILFVLIFSSFLVLGLRDSAVALEKCCCVCGQC